MFKFRTQREKQMVVNQSDLILQKRAELVQCYLVRRQRYAEARIVAVPDRPETESPHEFLRAARVKAILEVHVENILMVHE